MNTVSDAFTINNLQKGEQMKKIMTAVIAAGAFALGACDSNANDVAKNGDTVVIDFAGFKDGVQFPGGTATGYKLTLGSNTFVPGFEEQVVGMARGETRDINITFPTNYYPELAGQDVVFKVTVQDIIK